MCRASHQKGKYEGKSRFARVFRTKTTKNADDVDRIIPQGKATEIGTVFSLTQPLPTCIYGEQILILTGQF